MELVIKRFIMERFKLHIEAESRIRWKVYVRFGGEFSETDHSNMARRWLLSLHYCPVRRNDKITFEGKKVSNAVWRFKSGEQTDLFVKLFSIAASRIRAIQENRHRAVLVPVPASTREKHRTRYEAFCRKLSADMGVADGYGAITVAYDRAQFKGTHGNGDRTANLEFHPERFRGKCVLLVDDVLTTGATFIALRRKLIAHGAKFVIGIFLAKTIAFEDERKDLSINDYTNPTTSK